MKLNGRTEAVSSVEYTLATERLLAQKNNAYAYHIERPIFLPDSVSYNLNEFLNHTARTLAPANASSQTLDIDSIPAVRRALGTGVVIGVDIARIAYEPTDVYYTDIYKNLRLPVEIVDNPFEQLHQVGKSIAALGWRGVAMAGATTAEYIRNAADTIEEDESVRHYVRIGAGVVFSVLGSTFDDQWREEDFMKFRKEVEAIHGTSINWDSFDWASDPGETS